VISAFERTVAFRYLRARRREGFISVTAGFSLAGIALGVAALIIVMSVKRLRNPRPSEIGVRGIPILARTRRYAFF